MPYWVNNDGLRVRVGRTDTDNQKAGEYGAFSSGSIHQIRVDLDAGLASGLNVFYHAGVPQTGFVKRAYVFAEDALVGGTITAVGLYDPQGEVFDADGLDAAVTPVVGEEVELDGAVVGTRLEGDPHALYHIGVTTSADVTDGKVTLVVEYFLGHI